MDNMDRPGSATNLKASDSTLPSHKAPGTKPGYQMKGSLGINAEEE
jgi:hypothetical protein